MPFALHGHLQHWLVTSTGGNAPERQKEKPVRASGGAAVRVHLRHGALTILEGVGVGRQAQGAGAVLTLEAAPVEELASALSRSIT